MAGWAYLVSLAWMLGRHQSVLSGKPAYEAREILAARVRSAVARAGDVRGWASELLRGVRVKPESLRPDDALWWRAFSEAPHAPWRRLRQRQVVEEVLTAAALLPDWLYSIRGALPDADLSDIPTHQLPVEIA